MKIRLDKILAANGFGSRKEIKKALHKKPCKINGTDVFDSSVQIDPACDTIEINGEPVKLRTSVYLMFNKPAGCVTSTKDPVNKTVMEYLNEPFSKMNLFPIGRLDIDTEGLIIITDDGSLSHKITSPKSGIMKKYYFEFENHITENQIEDYKMQLQNGIKLKNGYTCLPASLEQTENITGSKRQGFLIGIQEGKYHQIKKMCKALGNELVYLKRIAVGPVYLDTSLKSGSYRELTSEETNSLAGLLNR